MRKPTSSINNTIFKILIISCLFVFSLPAFAQENGFHPSLAPQYSIGILGGYHFQKDRNKIELGISRAGTVHGGFYAWALTTEYCKIDDKGNYGFTASAWVTALMSFGAATTYSSDFDNQRAWALRPMVGLGLLGLQVVYEYDLFLIKPNYDFGARNRIAVRLNLGLFETN